MAFLHNGSKRKNNNKQTNKPASKFPLTIWKNYPTSAHKPERSHTEEWAGALSLFLEGFKEGLPCWLSGKESSCNTGDARDAGLIPGLGRSPGEGNDNPLQYSSLGNPRDRGAWWGAVHGVAKSQTQRVKVSSFHSLTLSSGPRYALYPKASHHRGHSSHCRWQKCQASPFHRLTHIVVSKFIVCKLEAWPGIICRESLKAVSLHRSQLWYDIQLWILDFSIFPKKWPKMTVNFSSLLWISK